jgi:hypothetical protein
MDRIQKLFQKPRIYKTIVQSYFLFSIIFIPFTGFLTLEMYAQHLLENPNPRNSLAGLFIVPVIFGVLISTVLCLVSFTLLYFNRESGYYLSALTLLVLFVILWLGISSIFEYASIIDIVEIGGSTYTISNVFSLSTTGVIGIFLILAWNKWREIITDKK